MEHALSALERILPVAAALARLVRLLALTALAAAVVIAAVLLRDGLPEPPARTLATLVPALAAFVPGVVLLLFHRALREVLELPARLRAAPMTGREHVAELGRLAGRGGGPRPRLSLRLWRLLALGRSTRELLTPYAPLAALLSPPFLLAAGLSVLAVPVLLAAALLALVSVALG